MCKPCATAAHIRTRTRRLERLAGKSPDQFKKCRDCDRLLPASDFSREKASESGLRTACKKCERVRFQKRFAAIENYLRRAARDSAYRARKRRIHWEDFGVDHLMGLWDAQGGRCPYTGLEMSHCPATGREGSFWTNATIDRIDSDKGYVIGNLQLVSHWANVAKGHLSDAEFRRFLLLAGRHCHDRTMVASPSAVVAVQIKSSSSTSSP